MSCALWDDARRANVGTVGLSGAHSLVDWFLACYGRGGGRVKKKWQKSKKSRRNKYTKQLSLTPTA
jgi:hypothetical protein